MSDGFIAVPSRRTAANQQGHGNFNNNSSNTNQYHHQGSHQQQHHGNKFTSPNYHGSTHRDIHVDNSSEGTPNPFSNPFSYLNEVGSGNVSEVDENEENSSPVSNSHLKASSPYQHQHHQQQQQSLLDTDVEEFDNEEALLAAEEERKSQIIKEFGKGPHMLSHEWAFWYLKPPVGSKSNQANYESLLRMIGTFSTVEDFWAIYLRLKRPDTLTNGTTEYSLFRSEIRPVWEDPSNASGGKLLIRLRKGGVIAARYWETLMLSLIGGELNSFIDEICGLLFSIRPYENIISIWTRHSQDMDMIQKLRDILKKMYSFAPGTPLEYKPHHFVKEAPQAEAKDLSPILDL